MFLPQRDQFHAICQNTQVSDYFSLEKDIVNIWGFIGVIFIGTAPYWFKTRFLSKIF